MAYVGTTYSPVPAVAVDIPPLSGYDRQWSGYQWLYRAHTGGTTTTGSAATSAPQMIFAPTDPASDPTLPGGDGPLTPPLGTSGVDMSARGLIDTFLSNYGLDSLSQWAWNKYLDGEPVEAILLDLRATPEYRNRFPGMEGLAKEGRAISETAYIDYETTIHQLLQQYGVPAGMYDTPQDIANLLLRDVSASEVSQRLQLASTAAYQAPKEVRDALATRYGATVGDLTGWFLDPTRAEPLLEKQFAAAQIAGAADIQGVGGVTTPQAEALAQQGISWSQALQGFGNVASLRGLSAGFGETTSESELTAAQFGDAGAARRVERIQRARLAPFSGGGGPATGSTGVVGLGSAATR